MLSECLDDDDDDDDDDDKRILSTLYLSITRVEEIKSVLSQEH